MSPAPEIVHQLVLQNLFLKLYRKLSEQWLIIISPVDVVLDEENVVQPDIVIARKDSLYVKEKGIFGLIRLCHRNRLENDTCKRDRAKEVHL